MENIKQIEKTTKSCKNCVHNVVCDKKLDLKYFFDNHDCEHYQPKLPEDGVVLSREEYDCLKRIEKSYDPFWFCAFGGCEGMCKECKNTCEMSIFVKERKKTAEKIYKDIKFFLDDKTLAIIKRYFKEILDIEIKE